IDAKGASDETANKEGVENSRLQNVMTELEEIKRQGVLETENKASDINVTEKKAPPEGFAKNYPTRSNKLPKIIGVFIGLAALLIIVFLVLKLKSYQTTLFGKKGEIIWWGIEHDEVVYQPLIDEFEKVNPDIKIVYKKQSPQDYRQRLSSSLVSEKGPDIFEIHQSWIPMFTKELSLLPESIMKGVDYKNSFYPVITSGTTTSKGIVAMPLEYDAITLYINEDIFTTAVKKPPETWAELKDLVNPKIEGSLTIRDKNSKIIQSGIALGTTENIDYWPEIISLMLYQNRVNLAKPDDILASYAMSFYKDFSALGVWDTTLPNSTNAFAQGQLAMYFGTSKSAKDIVKENPNLRFRTVKLPQLPKNQPTDPDFSYSTLWVQSVWEKSINKEAAWTFLKYLAENGSLERLNKNIEKYEMFQIPYPRPEMNVSFRDDKILGSIVALVLDAKSWYLADKTNDGEDGINSRLKKEFKEILDNWKKDSWQKTLLGLSGNIMVILSDYNISAK
ncbi:hypothetical protein A2159_00245, partial [Candidatus Woesebacteria bacterium RBG_13_34_9]